MSSLATAAIGSAVVGGVLANKGADKASKRSRKASQRAIDEERRQYDQTREDLAPWREAGMSALGQLENPIENFYASPDFDFRMNLGMENLGNRFALKGGGGNAMKALEAYRSDLASGEYGNWWNRTMSQAEAGRGATNTGVQAGEQSAANIAGIHQNTGSQLAANEYNRYANINNALQSGISNYLYQRPSGNSYVSELDPALWRARQPQQLGG